MALALSALEGGQEARIVRCLVRNSTLASALSGDFGDIHVTSQGLSFLLSKVQSLNNLSPSSEDGSRRCVDGYFSIPTFCGPNIVRVPRNALAFRPPLLRPRPLQRLQ